MSGPYDRVWYAGEQFNRRTMNMLIEAERRYGGKFQYYQGSYNKGVGASAGTHDGGGAVDLWAINPQKALRALRSVGFAARVRNPSQGSWPWHIHGIALGDQQAAPLAKQQMEAYRNGRDGLAGNGPDTFWRPSPIKEWGKNVGPGHDQKKAVDWFVIKRQLAARTPTTKWAVKVLQRNLNAQGWHLITDGVAGPKTRAAFRKYRENQNLGPFNAARKLLNPNFRPVRNK